MMSQIRSIQRAHAVGRVLWKLGNRHRAVRGGVAAAKTAGKDAARATRVLVLEITGFFFAVFAAMGLGAAWRQWSRLQSAEPAASASHAAVALAFSAVFIYFSATSFWKARRLAYAAVKTSNG
jgi:hypothetical protein